MRLLLLICCLFVGATQARSPIAPKLNAGDMVPEVLGLMEDGTEVRADAHRGKILVVNFWATWCTPCHQEISVLAGLRKQVPADQMEIVSINFGESRQVFAKASEALEATKLTLTRDRNNKLAKQYRIAVIPFLMLVNTDGKIQSVHTGFGDKSLDNLVDNINIMLRKQSEERAKAQAK
jgi:thiol-disulfide isomerase/thioredoxin